MGDLYALPTKRNLSIVALRKKGMQLEDIAARFGISYQRVQQVVGKLDPKANLMAYQIAKSARQARQANREEMANKRYEATQRHRQLIIDLRDAGYNQAEIALRVGTCQPAVSRFLIRLGMRTNKPRRPVEQQARAEMNEPQTIIRQEP